MSSARGWAPCAGGRFGLGSRWRWNVYELGWQFSGFTLAARELVEPRWVVFNGNDTDLFYYKAFENPLNSGVYVFLTTFAKPTVGAHFPFGNAVEPDVPVL